MDKKILSAIISFAVLALPFNCFSFGFIASRLKVAPPDQPNFGAGGSNYKYRAVRSTHYNRNSENEYWIFRPAGIIKSELPVIALNHGWSASHPVYYKAWITHLVKKGNIVIFPILAKEAKSGEDYTQKAISAILLGLEELKSKNIKADFENFALIGHSLGGIVSANIASLALEAELPTPKALIVLAPSATALDPENLSRVEMGNLEKIPAGTLLISAIGDKDKLAPGIFAKQIFSAAAQIPANRKNFITIPSDSRIGTYITADHFIPCGPSSDVLDYYGIWKLSDSLCEAAFLGKNIQTALADTQTRRFMGIWSDGTPFKQLEIYNSLD